MHTFQGTLLPLYICLNSNVHRVLVFQNREKMRYNNLRFLFDITHGSSHGIDVCLLKCRHEA